MLAGAIMHATDDKDKGCLKSIAAFSILLIVPVLFGRVVFDGWGAVPAAPFAHVSGDKIGLRAAVSRALGYTAYPVHLPPTTPQGRIGFHVRNFSTEIKTSFTL